jgi:hypothetical protein
MQASKSAFIAAEALAVPQSPPQPLLSNSAGHPKPRLQRFNRPAAAPYPIHKSKRTGSSTTRLGHDSRIRQHHSSWAAFRITGRAEILAARPLILPARHFVYPGQAEEVERGALEVLVRPCEDSSSSLQEFLATCALGFRDPAVPTGLWSCPNPEEICAVSGGYAYIISTTDPERFTMISFRPVLDVRAAPEQNLLLFVGHSFHHCVGCERAGMAVGEAIVGRANTRRS